MMVRRCGRACGTPGAGRSGAMWWTRHKAVVIAVAAVVVLAGLVAGLLLALRGGGKAKLASAPSPTHAAPQLRSPFTSEPVPSLNRVLAVKIDNIVNAR